jgi:hypothetical protein
MQIGVIARTTACGAGIGMELGRIARSRSIALKCHRPQSLTTMMFRQIRCSIRLSRETGNQGSNS